MGQLSALLAGLGIEHLGLFIASGILLNLTPGPDVLYILSQGARRGARAGSAAALGIVTGCCVHITAAALGVSALIAASSTAFSVLKWLGAAYLAYVGWTMLRTRRAISSVATSQEDNSSTGLNSGFFQNSLKSIFINGFWTNTLNPKVALFFLAFVPQFIDPQALNKVLAFFVLGLVFNLNSLWINLGYGWIAAYAGNAFAGAQSPRWVWLRRRLHWLERAAGALFLAFGLKLALMDNPSH